MEWFVLQKFSLKPNTMEVLTIRPHETIIVGSYTPDSNYPQEIQERNRLIDYLISIFPNNLMISIEDLHCRAGNKRPDKSSLRLNEWIDIFELCKIHQFTTPILTSSLGFLDVLLYKDFWTKAWYYVRGLILRLSTKIEVENDTINKSLMDLPRKQVDTTVSSDANPALLVRLPEVLGQSAIPILNSLDHELRSFTNLTLFSFR